MKTYQTFTKNGETFLREKNPLPEKIREGSISDFPIWNPAFDHFEQTAISEAKVLLNPQDGKDSYLESELTPIYQMQDEETGIWGTVRYITELVDDLDSPVREVWKYIGERKPMGEANPYFKGFHGEKSVGAIHDINGNNYLMSEIRKQGGLKRDIIELVLNLAAPDDDCMLSDFLMALQFVLDKHQFCERKRIIGIIEAEKDKLICEFSDDSIKRNMYNNLLSKINDNGKND